MKRLKVKTPAKINLTLEVLNKRIDGFHNIQSLMQTIDLYDYLTFEIEESSKTEIILNGTSKDIPYDLSNLVYKSIEKYLAKVNKTAKFNVFIEKNIPVSAGLAGGSTNAAGTFAVLNSYYNNILDNSEMNNLCSELGSDLNFCLCGGCCLCTSRGEILKQVPYNKQHVSLIKPKNIAISAKEAYTKFSLLSDKTIPNNTMKLKELLIKGEFNKDLIYNSLEIALLPDYPILRQIKSAVKNSLMSGSGPTFFVLDEEINISDENFWISNNHVTIGTGVELCEI